MDGHIISSETLIPLGGAIAIALLIWRVSSKTTEIINRLDSIERDLQDHWTKADQLEWILQLREANPGIKVPLPRHHYGTENL